MNLSPQELRNLESECAALAFDPEWHKFKNTPPDKRFYLPIAPQNFERYLLHEEKIRYWTPERLRSALLDVSKREEERKRQEIKDIESFLEHPASRLSTEYFRRNLDSPFFDKWRARYAEVMPQAAVDFVDLVKRDRKDPGTYPFDFDNDAPEPKRRNYPARRKIREEAEVARENIVEFVRTHPNATDADIGNFVGLKRAAVSRHLTALDEDGIIRRSTIRRWGRLNAKGALGWCNQRTITVLKPLANTL